ncbi:hypothetical protein C0995_010401 [Termitomyces sp. Mi166|nr:hypothetical protein C0995_010401 [Termitomyces sp. Mi166\
MVDHSYAGSNDHISVDLPRKKANEHRMDDDHIPAGIICTAEEYNRVLSGDLTIYCLSRNESIALAFVSEVGFISLLSVSYVFFIIIRNAIQYSRYNGKNRISVVQEPMDVLMLSLFIADFTQSLGAAANLKWVNKGKVEIGPWCTAQGVFQQFGETGGAISTLLIAIYTFVGVWWRIGMGKQSVRVTRIIVCLVWLFIILMVVIGNATHADRRRLYESPTPYWCWIGNDYLLWRIFGEYMWFWITLGFSLFAYTLLFFWSRGNITLDEESWWRFTIHPRRLNKQHNTRMQSLIMLAYPIVYCILVIPLSIVRWIGFVQDTKDGSSRIGAAATLTVVSIYSCAGAANVVLLLTTRPNSVLFGYRTTDSEYGPQRSLSIVPSQSRSRGSDDLGRLPSRSSVGSGLE